MIQCYFPSFHHLLGLIFILLRRKVVEISSQRFESEITSEKRKPNDQSSCLKKKRKERGEEKPSTRWPMKGSKLGGPWNVSSLLAFGLFQVWWPLEGIQCLKVNEEAFLLSGQWKVPSLMAFKMFQAGYFGRRNINILFTSFHFSPQKILFKHFSH